MAIWEWADKGPRWSFVVDTDSYAGNFDRELSSFVVGRCDEGGDHRGAPYREMFEKEIRGHGRRGHFEKEDPFEGLVVTRVDDHGDDFICRAPMSLAPTPGYSNDGKGIVSKLKSGKEPKHPAYNSVAIFLSRKPTDAELRLLAERAKKFSNLPPLKPWDHRPKFLGCRLVEERTEIVSHDLMFSAGVP
jgi:hypothetical protein